VATAFGLELVRDTKSTNKKKIADLVSIWIWA
jgi:hypothetical protein